MKFDLHNNIKAVTCIKPQALTSNGTLVSDIIDLQGYESCEFAISSGVRTDGTFTPSLEEGDAANLSDTAAVTDASLLLGTLAGAVISASATTKKLGYRGSKRYVRLTLTGSAITSGVAGLTAIALLGHAQSAPVA